MLDLAFQENGCRVRTGHATANFAVLRHIARNLVRQGTTAKAGWDETYLRKVLAA